MDSSTCLHEAGDGDKPEFCGVDNVTTVELGEAVSGTWTSKHGNEQRVYQETIGQPTVQKEHGVRDNRERVRKGE